MNQVLFNGAKLLDGNNPASPDMNILIAGERVTTMAPDAMKNASTLL